MLKKILACSIMSIFIYCGAASIVTASENKGPEDITMVSTHSKKPKPAIFPHKEHQERLECAECHHQLIDGKQAPYSEGNEIKKCETCHNKEILAGKKKGKLKLDTIKGAGHGNCLACHKEVAKKDKALKALKKCSTCHPKKKK